MMFDSSPQRTLRTRRLQAGVCLCVLCVFGIKKLTLGQEPSAPQAVSAAELQVGIDKLGDLAGQIWMSEDFDDWPPDLQEALGMNDPR